MQLYADSNDGRLPPYGVYNGAKRLLWSYWIKPYLKADRTYRCPALSSYVDNEAGLDANATSRVFGFAVPYPRLFDPAKPSTKLSAIPRFSRTMLMCDSYTMRVNPDTNAPVEVGYPVFFCRACNDRGYNEELPDGNVAGRHGGRSDVEPYGKTTVLYCDLHAKAIDKERVVKRYTSAAESVNSDMWAHFDNIQH